MLDSSRRDGKSSRWQTEPGYSFGVEYRLDEAIEQALRRSRDLGDTALVTQAPTALGDEYTALGERERARVCYRRAVAQVDGTEMPMMGVFARRALLREQEWNPCIFNCIVI